MLSRVLCILIAVLAPLASAQTVTVCDLEAAHPSDPQRVGPGVSSGQVDTSRAIQACRLAVDESPEEPRFHYQLGRGTVYAADRAKTDWRTGIPHVRRAAELGHTQAKFVLSLLYQRDQLWCKAEPWLQAAADDGLKAARISYVNEALAGRLADCGVEQNKQVLLNYLDEAASQINGWYESMLLVNLRRDVEEL